MSLIKAPLALAAVLSLIVTGSAIAQGNGKGKPKGNGADKAAVGYGVGGCPPGLAKKDPKCIPPGQAKKEDRERDLIDDRYQRVEDLWKYRLDMEETYYYLDDEVVRVDPETREILEVVGVLSDLLDN